MKASVQAQAVSSRVRVAQHLAYLVSQRHLASLSSLGSSLMLSRSSPDSRFLWKQLLFPLPMWAWPFKTIPRGGRKQLLTSLAQFPCQSESLACCHLLLWAILWSHAGTLFPGVWGDGTPCCSLAQVPHPSLTKTRCQGSCRGKALIGEQS